MLPLLWAVNLVMLLSSPDETVFELVFEECWVDRKEYSLVGKDCSVLMWARFCGLMAMSLFACLPEEQPVHLLPIYRVK